MDILQTKKMTASGIAFTGPCALASMLIGTDGANDPTVTIYDGIDNTGTEKVPTSTYDASALGLNGFMGGRVAYDCVKGIYVEITTGGTVEVIVGFKPL